MNENKVFHLALDYEGQHYEGSVIPSEETGTNRMPVYFKVEIGGKLFAYLCCGDNGWRERDKAASQQGLVNAIGNYILAHYE